MSPRSLHRLGVLIALATVSLASFAFAATADARPAPAKPTVVLVHGAFADSSGFTQAASGDPDVKALVYVAAFALDSNELLSDLANRPVAHALPPLPASRSNQSSPTAAPERTFT